MDMLKACLMPGPFLNRGHSDVVSNIVTCVYDVMLYEKAHVCVKSRRTLFVVVILYQTFSSQFG